MKYVLAAAALIAGSPAAAWAQGSPDDFGGVYASVGPAFVRGDVSANPGGVTPGADIEATAAALRIGYDYAFANNIVVGASWWSIVDRVGDASDPEPEAGELDASEVGVRVGYAAGPWLPFVGVGYTSRKVTLGFECPPAATTCIPGDQTEAQFDDGAVSYRVGLERRFDGGAFLGVSYMWADYDPQGIGFATEVEGDLSAFMIDVGLRL